MNDRKNFEIPALFYLASKKVQKIRNHGYHYFEIPHSGFPHWRDKKSGNFKTISVLCYTVFINVPCFNLYDKITMLYVIVR